MAVAIVAEQLARGLADVAFSGPTLASELRRLAGAPAAASPETVALTSDLSAPAVVGEPGIAIDVFGDTNALLLLPAQGGWTLGSVAVDGPGGGPDLTRPTVPIATGSAREVAGQVNSVNAGELTRWTALGLATCCADLVGTMHGALDTSVEYAKARRQYGMPIGSFQAVQHMLADAAVAARRFSQHRTAWGMGSRRVGSRRSRELRRCGKGILLAGSSRRVRDGDPSTRRYREHLGVHCTRVPAKSAAFEGRARRGRAEPPKGPRTRRSIPAGGGR